MLVLWILLVVIVNNNANGSLSIVNSIFFTRIPVFVIGAIVEKNIVSKNVSNKKIPTIVLFAIVSALVFLCILNMLYNENYWVSTRLLFAPCSIFLLLLLSEAFDKVKLNFKFLNYLGGITLEIYLIHEKILSIVDIFVGKLIGKNMMVSILDNLLSIVLAIIFAGILKKTVDYISDRLKNKYLMRKEA